MTPAEEEVLRFLNRCRGGGHRGGRGRNKVWRRDLGLWWW